MALSVINPFCYDQYQTLIAQFASWLADYVQSTTINGRTGWISWFTSHSGWVEVLRSGGVLGRATYHTTLQCGMSGNDDVCLISLVNQIIVHFHGMPKQSAQRLTSAPNIRRSLQVLQHETDNLAWTQQQKDDLNDGCRIAPISKVYQMLDPHKWTIYDSRVAYALARLVELFYAQNSTMAIPDFLRFPVPPRFNPPKGWRRPFGGVNTKRQGHLAFVYASWLLRKVADILRSNSQYGDPPTMQNPAICFPLNPDWQVYHLEMALWMLGDKQF